jgi:hypothetical protein
VELTVRLAKKAYYHSGEFENLWFKFPLRFEKTTKGLAIYKRVLQFLYPTTFLKRSSTDYESYEALMLQKRPFRLFLRHQRKVDRHYSRIEHRYSAEV